MPTRAELDAFIAVRYPPPPKALPPHQPARLPVIPASRRLLQSEAEEIDPQLFADRPRSRADCIDGPRPCPWVACKHNLYLEVNPETGSLRLLQPVEPWEMHESCALDFAERGAATLEDVGAVFGLTRERVRQIEVRGLFKLRLALARLRFDLD